MDVTVKAALKEVQARSLPFEREARDEVQSIGSGRRERVIVDWDRFLDLATKKAGRVLNLPLLELGPERRRSRLPTGRGGRLERVLLGS
jgi:hypothetical protein